MFQTNTLHEDQSYLVIDYDNFSLTVGVLKITQKKPKLVKCVRSFFPSNKQNFQASLFEQYFRLCCQQLQNIMGELPKEVCLFIDHGESLVSSTGYTFARENTTEKIHIDELNFYASQLMVQSESQSRRLWHEDYGYSESDRRLVSIFLSQLSLDKRFHIFPLGKDATHVTMKCLFFYGSKILIDGISRSLRTCGYTLLTCVPISCVFLNNLCNRETFLENHLHMHYGYDSISVILHLGKHVQEIQSLPIGWRYIYDQLEKHFSPLEREAILMGNDFTKLEKFPEWLQYREFLMINLKILFEKFDLHWSFTQYSISTQGPAHLIGSIVQEGLLMPWIQKNANMFHFGDDKNDHWLQYCNTLDPLFSLHSHPLLSLVRSVFLSNHAYL